MNSFDINNIDWKTTLLGETNLMGVLSRAIQTDPDREWLNSLVDQDIFSESPLENNCPEIDEGLSLLQSWSNSIKGGISDEQFVNLQTDYSRLFIGPAKPIAPPWESVYFNEDRMIFQEQTVQVRGWYRRFGIESEKLHKEPDDHIGLELSFLAYLAGLGLQALEAGDETRFTEILQAKSQFISQHPIKWAKNWDALVEKNAHSDFYRGLSRLIYGALLATEKTLKNYLSKEVSL